MLSRGLRGVDTQAIRRLRLATASVALGLMLAACSEFPRSGMQLLVPEPSPVPPPVAEGAYARGAATQGAATSEQESPAFSRPGSDRFLRERPGTAPGAPAAATAPAAPGTGASPAPSAPASGGVTLNFENTSLLEVVKVVLGDLLGRSYTIDPGVQGTVTLQSSTPIARDALLPTLELLLRMNNAALIDAGDVVQVLPRERALQGRAAPQLGDSGTPLPRGYRVQVVPLRYIGAEEMRAILEPLADPGSLVRVDSRRNLLILAGSGREVEQLLETVDLFDVDWMAGMSVALFRPDYVQAKTLAEELEKVLGTEVEGPLAGLVRFVVIERLNGLLVVTPRREYLAKVATWVERLDRSGGGIGERLFVYHVQNGKAADLAEVLNQVFEREEEVAAPQAELAPGLEPVLLSSTPETAAPDQAATGAPGADASAAAAAPASGTPVPAPGEGLALGARSRIRIIADEVNNAVLIMAGPEDYGQVEAAIRQLDIAPLQVLIEATIAEVRLEDQLSQGIEWFVKNSLGSKKGTSTLDLGAAGLTALTPGFSYAITDSAAAVRAVLNVLATESKAKIISSPSLMVLNNQKATIQVGDQVPITTQQQQATTTTSNIVNSIEFRDTGVLLSVTPRVNAGGLVIMEVEQEVSNVAPNAATPLTPTIQQRKINSTVAVQSGETVVLGGLIRENDNSSDSGLPGLREIPVLGWFFGARMDELTRTELVVLITPRAVRGAIEARDVTDEFRRKMESLKPADEPRRGFGPLYHNTDELRGALDGAPAAAVAETGGHTMRMERVLDPGRPSRPRSKGGPEPDTRVPVSLVPSPALEPPADDAPMAPARAS
jgi:general secretion pathway protein D